MEVRPRDFLEVSHDVAGRVSRTGETLLHIRRQGSATVSELASTMGVARSTVAERLDRLRAHGLVHIEPAEINGRGRPAATYTFAPDAGCLLTCHLGMTGMQLGVCDLAAQLLVSTTVDLEIEQGPQVVVDAMADAFGELLSELGSAAEQIYGIGVGLPGPVELASTAVVEGHSWSKYEIADRLSERFGAPAFVDQDVNLLALGEQKGAWPDTRVLLCLKVGSVIGCGIVIDGRIVDGSSGLAGEIGHTGIAGHDEPCGCGNRGCLNTVAGGRALVARLTDEGLALDHVRDIVRLCDEGVSQARLAIRQAGRDIGTVLAGAVNLLNPGVVALWGYLAGAEEHLMAGLRESLYKGANPSASRHLQLVSTELGDTTGLAGAALMVVEQVLAPHAIDRRLDAAERAHTTASA